MKTKTTSLSKKILSSFLKIICFSLFLILFVPLNLFVGYKFAVGIQKEVDQVKKRLPNSEKTFFMLDEEWRKEFLNYKKSKITLNFKNKKVFMIKTEKKVKLSAIIYQQKTSKKWIILLHGWKRNKFTLLYLANFYNALGFNVLLYDARGHGESKGGFCTMSYHEKNDLACIISWIKKNYPTTSLFLHGLSMGGATIIEYIKNRSCYHNQIPIKACIIDGSFAYLAYELDLVAAKKTYSLPSIFYHWGIRWYLKKMNFYDIATINPIHDLNKASDVPFLFLVAGKDYYVPISHSQTMFRNKVITEDKKINSRLLLVKKAKHVRVFQQEYSLVSKVIKDFILNAS